ncbi:hypothetical protein BUQ74_19960 [Leptospira weilii serovar Heyan]|nr:hypothetical protein BUQ74_19960 [Leptospira weilii serovar Heyan]
MIELLKNSIAELNKAVPVVRLTVLYFIGSSRDPLAFEFIIVHGIFFAKKLPGNPLRLSFCVLSLKYKNKRGPLILEYFIL